ncbi:IDO-domain-containing protein [Serendipita vermifera]|nr:IDO-domain-containing protein [Serendipita vermifera]
MTRMKCPKARGIPESKALWSTSYEIDSVTGFVPCSPPVTSLPPAFARWEQALASATHAVSLADDDSPHASAKRLSSRQWRESIANAPVLDTTPLEQDSDLLRRAHHVLAFLVHFYVHSCPSSNSILIPESLAVPLVRVSKLLSIAPVLTFADTVLWNHEIIDPSLPLTRSNIRPLTLFTGSDDEANFYGCCAEIELRGVEALRAIANFYDITSTTSNTTPAAGPAAAASRTSSVITRPTLANDKKQIHEEQISQASSLNYDHTFVIDDTTLDHAAACLKTVAGVIRDLTAILQSVRQICDPHAFYFSVRPWFRGSDAAGPAASSQRCWIYQGVDESQVLELSGPSAGQSSIIHTLDIFLDVDHSNDSTMTHQSLSSSSSAAPSTTFPPTSGATVPAPSVCPLSKLSPPSQSGTQSTLSSSSSSASSSPSSTSIPLANANTTTCPSSSSPRLPNGEFMTRMRKYMPGSHQAFLEQLTRYTHDQAGRRSIRSLASCYPEKLMKPYNEAVMALKEFRDAHIRIACLYVVSMSRKASAQPIPGSDVGMPSMCPVMRQRQVEPVRGTGGNELSLLLKSCRDATTRTLLH